MRFLEFRDKMFPLACFNIHQVYAWQSDFDRNNLMRWVKKGYLVRLWQGYYAFSEYTLKPNYQLFFANRMYRPSYVSLHTALAFYDMIPKAVTQTTSVTSLKTAPDYGFLSQRCGVHNLPELQQAVANLLKTTDLQKKQNDFTRLLFDKSAARKILRFGDFIKLLQIVVR